MRYVGDWKDLQLLKVLAVGCCAIAVMASNTNGLAAAAETSFAQTSPTSCSHPHDWKPTELELGRILARNRGYLWKVDGVGLHGDKYLDHAYPDWQREALISPEPANLCFANLIGLNLSGANLTKANLSFAYLNGANLSGAYLREVNLSNAHLPYVNLSGAFLRFANLTNSDLFLSDLSGVDLVEANLIDARLNSANLSGVDLTYARLSRADMTDARVNKAKLAYADLTGATYAPKASEPPDSYVTGIKGLETVHILSGKQTGAVQLRKLLQDGGLREEEREVTYSIERSVTTEKFGFVPTLVSQVLVYFGYVDGVELEKLLQDLHYQRSLVRDSIEVPTYLPSAEKLGRFAWVGGFLRIVGFDMTTAYGMHPARALTLIGYLWAAFTLVYVWPIRQAPTKAGDTNGIYQVFPADRIDEPSDEPTVKKEKVIRVKASNWFSALLWAAYFSLLSAVNIGFGRFTPGDWVRRLQGREYSLQAVGWVRRVAGAQALMSVYLLAMWVLTEFGRPFTSM
jgi:Pentapeptide repeats (8 copies)